MNNQKPNEEEKIMKNTPTPWYVEKFGYANRLCILKDQTKKGDKFPSAEIIAYIDMVDGDSGLKLANAKANAAFIVRAVNSHVELLEEAKEAKTLLSHLVKFLKFQKPGKEFYPNREAGESCINKLGSLISKEDSTL